MSELDRKVYEYLDSKMEEHIDDMVRTVVQQANIDKAKWERILLNCTKHAVSTVKPSSRLLNDSIDFNSFIKIVNIEYPNQDKCRYVNGVVFKKNVAHRRMKTDVDNPRILLLSNSLGYVQDDEGFIDLQAEIKQEESFM